MNKKQLLKQIQELKESVEALVEPKHGQLDYSKWVGRNNAILGIKGDALLKSYPEKSILYGNINFSDYNNKIKYEIIDVKALRKGDLFIPDEISYSNTELDDFKIYIADDDDGRYWCYALVKEYGFERIVNDYYPYSNFKVKRFLRE